MIRFTIWRKLDSFSFVFCFKFETLTRIWSEKCPSICKELVKFFVIISFCTEHFTSSLCHLFIVKESSVDLISPATSYRSNYNHSLSFIFTHCIIANNNLPNINSYKSNSLFFTPVHIEVTNFVFLATNWKPHLKLLVIYSTSDDWLLRDLKFGVFGISSNGQFSFSN